MADTQTATPSTSPALATAIDRVLQASLFLCAGTIIISIAIAQAAALIALVMWIAKIFTVKGYRFRKSGIQLPFAAFVLARLLSIPLSTMPEVSMEAFRTEIFFYGLFFVVLHEFDAENNRRMELLVWLLFGTAVFSAIYGTMMLLTGASLRAISTTSGYYTLGMYLCTILVMIFPLGSASVIVKPKWVWLAGSAVILLGLLLTYNRLHWAAAGVAIFVAGAIYDRKMLVAFGVVAAGLVLLLPDVGNRFGMMVEIGSNMSDRDIIWKGATLIWDHHPLTGFGLRTFREIFPLFDMVADKGIGSWHNDFLQVYMESGIMGLVPFIALHGAIVYYSVKAIRRLPAGDSRRTGMAGLLLTMIPFILAGFILDTLMHLLYFLIAGLLARLSGDVLQNAERIPSANTSSAASAPGTAAPGTAAL